MPYHYDIFVSYMHDEQMEGWVPTHLIPFLKSFVGNALNRPIDVFIDRDGIATGDAWPQRLQQAIARSRCLIGIWSPLYFHSEWCRRECAAMLHRESQFGFRTVANPKGLVLPINVFDGIFFPETARQIQWLDCQKYWIVGDGFVKTEKYVDFQDLLREWASEVAEVIRIAPPCEDSWMTDEWLEIPDDHLRPEPVENFEFAGLD